MARFRLLADCFVGDRRVKAGEVLERPDDWVGPMMTVPKRNSDGQAISEKGVPVREDKPLYEKLEDEKKDQAHG